MTNRLLLPLLLGLILLVSFSVKAQPPAYTLQTGVGSDGVIEDSFFHVTGSALFAKGLSRNSIVDFVVELSSQHYQDDSDSSAEKLFLQAEYDYTPRAGFRVPTYSVALRQQEEYRDNSNFDRSITSLLLSVNARIDDQSKLLGGLRFSEESSNNETSTSGYFVNFDYKLSDDWLLYATLNVASEETDLGNGAGSRIANKKHQPGEPGYVGPTTSDGEIGSDNTFLSLGGSYVLSSNTSLDMAVTQQTYDTDNGSISGNVITLDYFYRF